jgi:hypothetical protein
VHSDLGAIVEIMGFFYFDESIHPKGKFSLGAFVYSERALDDPVAQALQECGLKPCVEEFKSRARMDHDPRQSHARELLQSVMRTHSRIGIIVAPHDPRELLGFEAFKGLKKVISTNTFESGSHCLYFDKGIFTSATTAIIAAELLSISPPCRFCFEQESREVLGLQVADLVAHTCATMLLAQLGLVKKMVKAGENSGYDPNLDIDLGFELWASVRYNFFAAAPPNPDTWKTQLDFEIDVASRGLHIAESCDVGVRAAALARFGRMYLGCIH